MHIKNKGNNASITQRTYPKFKLNESGGGGGVDEFMDIATFRLKLPRGHLNETKNGETTSNI